MKSDFRKAVESYKRVLIFGTGDRARQEYKFAKRRGLNIPFFIVSGEIEYPEEFCGLEVKRINEVDISDKEKSAVIIGRYVGNNTETRLLLSQSGFKNILNGATQLYTSLNEKQRREADNVLHMSARMIDSSNYFKEILVPNVKIYYSTSSKNRHVARKRWDSEFCCPVQSGAAMTNIQLSENRDDQGENISEKGDYYNELTVGYWAWKNDIIHDYIGLFQYSRGLDISDSLIHEYCNGKAEVILPIPYYWEWSIASIAYYEEEPEIISEAIYKVSPEYYDVMSEYFRGHLFMRSNLIIAQRNCYCAYYKWMFSVFDEIEKILNRNDFWKERITAYMGEHLFNIYFIKHKNDYRIFFAGVKDML